MNTLDRVQAATDEKINREIREQARQRVAAAVGESERSLSRRIDELEREWDIERWLEMNASALAFSGVALGLLWSRKFFILPCLVLPFLFQHAVQGWCPPVPILRRKGVRTRREIDEEKYALKALRGDFAKFQTASAPLDDLGDEAWAAATL
jgi:hypothetical protein